MDGRFSLHIGIRPLLDCLGNRTDCNSHGSQGVLDSASKASLESEFGTSKEDECIVKILEMGEYQTYTVSFLHVGITGMN